MKDLQELYPSKSAFIGILTSVNETPEILRLRGPCGTVSGTAVSGLKT